MTEEIVCPINGHSDNIKTLSAEIDERTRIISGTQFVESTYVDNQGGIHYHSQPAPFSGIQTDIVAEYLRKPPEPTPKGFSGLLTTLGVLLLFLGGFVLCGTLLIVGSGFQLFLLVLGAGLSETWSELVKMVSNSGLSGLFDTLSGLVGLVFVFVCLIINIVFLVTMGLLIFRAKRTHDKKEQERVAREKPLWRDAIKKWERLYYCESHGIVFDPKTDKTCQPSTTIEFIYQPD